MSNNTLACKKYYDKNKGNPEFRKRKAMNTRRSNYKTSYYKRKNAGLWRLFQMWKNELLSLSKSQSKSQYIRKK